MQGLSPSSSASSGERWFCLPGGRSKLMGRSRERNGAAYSGQGQLNPVLDVMQVNAAMAARLLDDKKASAAGQAGGSGLLADDRFKRMFEDPAFAIDEDAQEFRSLHPNAREVFSLAFWAGSPSVSGLLGLLRCNGAAFSIDDPPSAVCAMSGCLQLSSMHTAAV